MKDYDIYSFVIIYTHCDFYDDRIYKRIVVRAKTEKIAEELVRQHAYSFHKEHNLHDYLFNDIVLIEKNFKTVNDFRLH